MMFPPRDRKGGAFCLEPAARESGVPLYTFGDKTTCKRMRPLSLSPKVGSRRGEGSGGGPGVGGAVWSRGSIPVDMVAVVVARSTDGIDPTTAIRVERCRDARCRRRRPLPRAPTVLALVLLAAGVLPTSPSTEAPGTQFPGRPRWPGAGRLLRLGAPWRTQVERTDPQGRPGQLVLRGGGAGGAGALKARGGRDLPLSADEARSVLMQCGLPASAEQVQPGPAPLLLPTRPTPSPCSLPASAPSPAIPPSIASPSSASNPSAPRKVRELLTLRDGDGRRARRARGGFSRADLEALARGAPEAAPALRKCRPAPADLPAPL